jgi:hypothetical protein
MGGRIALSETASVDVQQGAAEALDRDTQFLASYRVSGIADGSELFDVVVSMPSDPDRQVVLNTIPSVGGLTHIDFAEDVTIDTAGTALDAVPKHVQSGSSPIPTIEQGGSYTTNGTTLEQVFPGSQKRAGVAAATGSRSVTSAFLLGADDSIRLTATNQSGSSTDASITVALAEVQL